MPRLRPQGPPNTEVTAGNWPHATLRHPHNPAAAAAQRFAANLAAAMAHSGHTHRSLAAASGIAHTTIGRILNGETLCDIGTLAVLEDTLKQPLWAPPRT